MLNIISGYGWYEKNLQRSHNYQPVKRYLVHIKFIMVLNSTVHCSDTNPNSNLKVWCGVEENHRERALGGLRGHSRNSPFQNKKVRTLGQNWFCRRSIFIFIYQKDLLISIANFSKAITNHFRQIKINYLFENVLY